MTSDLGSLEHIRRRFRPYNADSQVIVLNTGAMVGPEAEAMMQALHSRSIGGFDHHFQIVAKRGAARFMEEIYVGYGHKSIGDCGSVTVFVEGVSMLCAKAIQDWRLYCGQEASTRYIDFSQQTFIDPIASGVSGVLLENHRALYLTVQGELKTHLIHQYPRLSGEDEKKWEKSINARAFDISRSLLPAGACTNLAWHSNIRQIGDHVAFLRHHPLEEVRLVAEMILEALTEAYPSSFSTKRYPETEEYNKRIMDAYYFERTPNELVEFAVTHDGVNRSLLKEYEPFFRDRPLWAELPRKIDECGTLTYEFALDFGSFRDIQRHRAVIQQMPLMTMAHGFERWYLDQMPEELARKVRKKLAHTADTIYFNPTLWAAPEAIQQFYIPMGYRLPNRLTGGLHGLTYLAERRARNDVHPTLQTRAHQIATDLRERFADVGMVVHTEDDPGRFSRKRGEQDIVMTA